MPELKPVPGTGLPILAIDHPLTPQEKSKWERLLYEHEKASNAIDAAGLLLENIYTAWTFAEQNGIDIPPFDPALESRYYEIVESFEKSKKAIRMVLDHKFGIRLRGSDIDIIEPPQSSLQGLILPVVVGIIIIGAAIGTAIYQSRVATDIANEYRKLLFDTDKMFCTDPKSAVCQKWRAFKMARKYEQNTTMADSLSATLKKGVKTVAGGLASGLIFAIVAIAFLRSR